MALSTLEKQRLRAALNNVELANRVETMLNYVDPYSDERDFQSPLPFLKIQLSAETHAFSCDEGVGFSEDLSTLITQGQATQWDVVMPFGFEAVDNAGVFSGTAPVFSGSGDIYGFTVIVSNNFNYKMIEITMTVNDVA